MAAKVGWNIVDIHLWE